MAFSSLTSGQLKLWADEVSPQPAVAEEGADCETGFPLVVDFLNTSGQTALAHQGQMLEQQVSDVVGVVLCFTSNALVSLTGALVEGEPTSGRLCRHQPTGHLLVAGRPLPSQRQIGAAQKPTVCHLGQGTGRGLETCQRLVAAFQDHFSPESPVLAAKQQRIVDFNLCLRRLLNEASMRLHQTSLQLAAEDDVGHSTEEDGQQPVDAVVEMLRRIYKQQVEPALVPSQSASFDDLLVASSQACRVAELLPGPVLLDPYISSMSSV